ncbi:MAG: pyridoxal phosphate-dependent aminotransferase [Myxococcota bacterium]
MERTKSSLPARLATNENPLGCSPRVGPAIARACAAPHRYPDPDAGELRAHLAARHRVGEDEVLVGAGATHLIGLTVRALAAAGEEVLTPRHAYAYFGEAARRAGRVHVEAPVGPRLELDVDALAARCGPATRVVFVANPGNPTGARASRDELARLLSGVPAHVAVVLDEAYAEYDAEPATGLALRGLRERLIVLRTFSKAYGLAALRVGYAVGGAPEVAAMAALREPFCVTRVAEAAAIAALSDDAHLEATRAYVHAERPRLAAALSDLGLDVAPSAASFLLVGTGRPARDVAAALLDAGVVVRALDAYGLPGHLRVSVGRAEDHDRLLAALAALLGAVPRCA